MHTIPGYIRDAAALDAWKRDIVVSAIEDILAYAAPCYEHTCMLDEICDMAMEDAQVDAADEWKPDDRFMPSVNESYSEHLERLAAMLGVSARSDDGKLLTFKKIVARAAVNDTIAWMFHKPFDGVAYIDPSKSPVNGDGDLTDTPERPAFNTAGSGDQERWASKGYELRADGKVYKLDSRRERLVRPSARCHVEGDI